jgi:hypothetical protein
MSKTLLFLGSVSSILFSNVALAQAPNVEGNWKMSVVGENLSATYTLIQRGNALTGTLRAPLGNFPLTGNVKGNKVNFAAKFGGKSFDFVGTVDGDNMQGVTNLPQKGRRNWTATRY